MTILTVRLFSLASVITCLLGCQSHATGSQATQRVAVQQPTKPIKMSRDWRVSPMTGDDFTKDCSTSSAPTLQILCSSYLVGALDMLDSLEATTDIPNLTCVPPDVTGQQMAKVIVKYGTDHPEQLHQQGSAFVLKAFGDAWPCTDEVK